MNSVKLLTKSVSICLSVLLELVHSVLNVMLLLLCPHLQNKMSIIELSQLGQDLFDFSDLT